MKKVLGIIKSILVWIFVIFAVSMTIFTVISVNTFNRNDRSILGYKAYIVNTDSMSKTDFKAGDLILVKESLLDLMFIIFNKKMNICLFVQEILLHICRKTPKALVKLLRIK